ncbi:hypothetical protein SAMN05421640_2867 [Ekhidna lutea]|uniref:Uncharacterized protein n=1 Tax=Ekhidna lutea TaxID=447679 RepID=A0A239KTF0_EKHLU|nr:hypothetical protein SAMN05421640_2867 [Ekhidna lutea]
MSYNASNYQLDTDYIIKNASFFNLRKRFV